MPRRRIPAASRWSARPAAGAGGGRGSAGGAAAATARVTARRASGRAGPPPGEVRAESLAGVAGAAEAAERMGGRVLVARQVGAGVEAFCGLTRDPDFGPVLAVGLGGRAIEALGLAAVALAPLDDAGARALVAEAPGLAQLA